MGLLHYIAKNEFNLQHASDVIFVLEEYNNFIYQNDNEDEHEKFSERFTDKMFIDFAEFIPVEFFDSILELK